MAKQFGVIRVAKLKLYEPKVVHPSLPLPLPFPSSTVVSFISDTLNILKENQQTPMDNFTIDI